MDVFLDQWPSPTNMANSPADRHLTLNSSVGQWQVAISKQCFTQTQTQRWQKHIVYMRYLHMLDGHESCSYLEIQRLYILCFRLLWDQTSSRKCNVLIQPQTRLQSHAAGCQGPLTTQSTPVSASHNANYLYSPSLICSPASWRPTRPKQANYAACTRNMIAIKRRTYFLNENTWIIYLKPKKQAVQTNTDVLHSN